MIANNTMIDIITHSPESHGTPRVSPALDGYSNKGSSVVTNVPLGWDVLIMGKAVSALSSQFSTESKTAE